MYKFINLTFHATENHDFTSKARNIKGMLSAELLLYQNNFRLIGGKKVKFKGEVSQ